MMREAIISKDFQNELKELLDVTAEYRRNWKTAEKDRGASKLHIMENEENLLTPNQQKQV